MRLERIGLVRAVAGVVLGGLVAAAGCQGGGGSVSGGSAGAGAVGGATGAVVATGGGAPDGGPDADCEICTKARRCCEVVQVGEPNCSFNAATCSSMVGEARRAYANGCLTYVMAVRGAWRGNPPAECR